MSDEQRFAELIAQAEGKPRKKQGAGGELPGVSAVSPADAPSAGASGDESAFARAIAQAEGRTAPASSAGSRSAQAAPAPSGSLPSLLDGLAQQYGLRKTSGRRSPERNAAVGGAKGSLHLADGEDSGAFDYAGDPDSMRKFTEHAHRVFGNELHELFYDGYGRFKGGKSLPVGTDHLDHVHASWRGARAAAAKSAGSAQVYGPPAETKTAHEIRKQEGLIAELERKSKLAHDEINRLMTGPQALAPTAPEVQAQLAKIRGTDADLKQNGGKPVDGTYNARVLEARAKLADLKRVQGLQPHPEPQKTQRTVRDPLTGLEVPVPDNAQGRVVEGVAGLLNVIGQNPVVQAVTKPVRDAQALYEQLAPQGRRIRELRAQQEKARAADARAAAPRPGELPKEDFISEGAKNLAQTFNPFGQAGRDLDLATARAAQSRVEQAAKLLPVPGTADYRKNAGDMKAASDFISRFMPLGGNRPSSPGHAKEFLGENLPVRGFDPFNVGAANSYSAAQVREIIRSQEYQSAYGKLTAKQKQYADAMALVKLVQDGQNTTPSGLAELAGTVADFTLFRALRPLAAKGGAATEHLAENVFGKAATEQAMQAGVLGSLQQGGARQWINDSLIRGLAEAGSEATFTGGFETASRLAHGKPEEMAQGGMVGLQSGAAGALAATFFPKLAGSGPIRRYLQSIPGGALEEGIQEVTQSLLEGERDPKKLQGIFLGAAAFGGLFSAGAGALHVGHELRAERSAAHAVASEVARKALELQQLQEDVAKVREYYDGPNTDAAYDRLAKQVPRKRIQAAMDWISEQQSQAQASPDPAKPAADGSPKPAGPEVVATLPDGAVIVRNADGTEATLDPEQLADSRTAAVAPSAAVEPEPAPSPSIAPTGAQHEIDFKGALSEMDFTGKYAEDAFERLSSGKALLFSERPGSVEAKIQNAWELGQISDPADIQLLVLDHYTEQAAAKETALGVQSGSSLAGETSTPAPPENAGPQMKRASGINVAPDGRGGFKLGDGSRLSFEEASDLASVIDASEAEGVAGDVIDEIGVDRYVAALDALEKVQGLDAIDEFRNVFRQYGSEQEAAHVAEAEAEAARTLKETATDGRGLIDRAYGSGSDKFGNTVVPESYTDADLEAIYQELKTSGRENTRGGKVKRYRTTAGEVDLESLVKDLRMIPADAYNTKAAATKKARQSAEAVKVEAAPPAAESGAENGAAPAAVPATAPAKKSRGHAVSVQVDGETRVVELDGEQRAAWDAEAERHRAAVDAIKGGPSVGKSERLRQEGYRHAENKRRITGQFTEAELRAQRKEAGTVRPGKTVIVQVDGEAREGKVSGMAFGKVTVQLDAGGKITVPRDQVTLDRAPSTVRNAGGSEPVVRRIRTIQSAGDVERAALDHGLSKEQARAAGIYFDRLARGWAKTYGRKVSDFYRENVAGIEVRGNRERVGVGGDYSAATAKGAIDFTADGRALIQLFDNADVSTLIHEGAHLMRRILSDADQSVLREWAGLEDGAEWTTEAEELVARGLERVIRDGDFADMGGKVRRVFERLRDWFIDLYHGVEGSSLDVDVSPEVREVFARALDLQGGKSASVARVRTESRTPQAPRTVEPKPAPKVDRAKLDEQLSKEEAELRKLLEETPLLQSPAGERFRVKGEEYIRLDEERDSSDPERSATVVGYKADGSKTVLSRHENRYYAVRELLRLMHGNGPLLQDEFFHGSRAKREEVQAGSMLTKDPVWAAGYTTRIDVNSRDLDETFIGSVHRVSFEPGKPLYVEGGLHKAEGELIRLAKENGHAGGGGLPKAARVVNEATGYDAIVSHDRDGTVNGMIPLVSVPVAGHLKPREALDGVPDEQIPDNLRKARDRDRLLFQEPETGRSYAFDYLRNPALGGTKEGFGQEIEPKGRYLTEKTDGTKVPEGWETGRVEFRNPLVLDSGGGYAEGDNWKKQLSAQFDGKTGAALTQAVIAAGYDGIITKDRHGTGEIVDLTRYRREPLKQDEEKVGPVYYSQARRIVEEKFPRAGTAEQLRGILASGGVKSDDAKWSGLDDLIANNAGKKLAKAEILAHLDANEVRVEEVVKGATPGAAAQERLRVANRAVIEQAEKEGIGSPTDYALEAARGELSSSQREFMSAELRPLVAELEEAYKARNATPNPSPTKYEQYRLPGGENYRELLLTLPEKPSGILNPEEVQQWLDVSEEFWGKLSKRERDAFVEEYRQDTGDKRPFGEEAGIDRNYRSSHWDEPNVLAHIRFDERTAPDGEKVLHVAEIQSDWHQEGRKKGYRGEKGGKPKAAVLEANDGGFMLYDPNMENPRRFTLREAAESAARESGWDPVREVIRPGNQPPAGPLSKTWHETAFRRMVRWAAENGFRRLTWDTGQAVAERFDLSKHLDRIEYEPEFDEDADEPNGLYTVHAYDPQGKSVFEEEEVKPERLAELVGEEVARKIQAGEGRSLKGERPYRDWMVLENVDLKSGGEGMKGFYDKILVDYANKWGKKFGAKVERGAVQTENTRDTVVFSDTAEVHSLEITPAMRRTALEGIPLFQEQEQGALEGLKAQTVTETPEFRKWFGESKVVDASGAPLVVYHGTPNGGFAQFDADKRGGNTGSSDGAQAFFFTDDPETADTYSRNHENETENAYQSAFGKPSASAGSLPNSAIMPVYLRMRRPLRTQERLTPVMVEKARKEGYDGIIRDYGQGTREFAVFDPEQVKSKFNRGSFDRADPRILFQNAKLPEAVAEKLARIGAIRYARGTTDFDAWTEELAGVAGEAFRKHASRIWPQAKEIYRQELQADTEAANAAVEPKYIGSINEAKLRMSGVAEDVIQLIRDDYERNRGAYDDQRRAGASWDEADAGKKAAVAKLLKEGILGAEQRPGRAYNDVEINALASMHLRLTNELYKAREAYEESDTTANRALLLEAETRFQAISLALQGASAEAGRALNIHRKIRQALSDHVPLRLVERALKVENTPTREKTPKNPQGRPAKLADKDFGKENRLVTPAEIREKLQKAKDALKSRPLFQDPAAPAVDDAWKRPDDSPVPPELWDDLVVLGLGLREGGYRRKDGWKRIMRSELGELSDRALDDLWGATKGEAKKRAVKQLTQKDLATKKLKERLERAGLSADEVQALVADFSAKVPENDPVAMIEYLRKQGRIGLGDWFISVYKTNLLSNPATQIRNFVGNTVQAGVVQAEHYVSAGLDALAPSVLMGRRRRADNFSEAWRGTAATVPALKSGLKAWAQIVERGYTDADASKLEVPSHEFQWKIGDKRILPKEVRIGNVTVKPDVFQPYNFVPRMMTGADAFFKAIAFESERAQEATRRVQAEKLHGGEAKARYLELLNHPEVLARAEAEAARATFNEDPNAIAKHLIKMRNEYPVLNAIFPFVSTPLNVVKQSIAYSPLGLGQLIPGKGFGGETPPRGAEATRVVARSVLGSSMLMLFAAMFKDADLTGDAPDDDEAMRDAFYRSGRKPYSIRIGDRWYSYNSLGPVSALLSVVAAWKNTYWSERKPTPAGEFWRVAGEVGRQFKEQSFLEGVASFIEFVSEPSKKAEKYAGGVLGGALPLSGLLRGTANATDERMRRADSVRDQLQAVVPGLSRKLPGRYDAFGQPVRKDPAGLGQLQPFVGPKVNSDPVNAELERLRVFPPKADKKLKIDNRDVRLTPEQQNEYQRRLGQAQYAAAKAYLDGPAKIDGITDEHRIEKLQERLEKARKAVRKRFIRELQAKAAANLARGVPTR